MEVDSVTPADLTEQRLKVDIGIQTEPESLPLPDRHSSRRAAGGPLYTSRHSVSTTKRFNLVFHLD